MPRLSCQYTTNEAEVGVFLHKIYDPQIKHCPPPHGDTETTMNMFLVAEKDVSCDPECNLPVATYEFKYKLQNTEQKMSVIIDG